ncbi:hypothetical protein F4821DRAFT_260067 [Hypoxylon rubiginosum]|uniref:Uncharacterized protein n=1 Tax=Hypoxylon rubiginosum TaxID=110542 RepID=A0ACC0D1I8_9PEZI|nr:hypothetical protein F4821DRAFT_260067 [Hypoxylon rubiginosum]
MTNEISPRLRAIFPDDKCSIIKLYLVKDANDNDKAYTVVSSPIDDENNTKFRLYDNTKQYSPVIAHVLRQSPYPQSRKTVVNIHVSIPSYGSTVETPTTVTMPVEEGITGMWSHFNMRVGIPGQSQGTESFEWRVSKGSEVRDIGGEHAHGWKLVRLGREGPGGGSGGGRGKRQKGETSDGKEVVAVWGTTSRTFSSDDRRPFTLLFYGSGKTGELGEEWRAVAIATAVRLYSYTEQKLFDP